MQKEELLRLIDQAGREGWTKLHLGSKGLTELPPEICNLQTLKTLNLRDNQLTWIPSEIGRLTNLTYLSFSHNKNLRVPPELSLLLNLVELHLNNNSLTTLPVEIFSLSYLKRLYANSNRLTAIPPEILHLSHLELLDLAGNQLTAIPPEIAQLNKLQKLFLNNNRLKRLPPAMRQMNQLKRLGLRDNPLLLPPEMLNDHKAQPLLEAYFAAVKPLHEAKILLVGEADVGKSSLVERLVSNTFRTEKGKTAGVNIRAWPIAVDDHSVQLNVWDFGGQEIYHATHQFFLTKRSLYLLVLNARDSESQNRLEYWLKLIESLGGNAPIIVVVNKTDEHFLRLDELGLKAKYRTIDCFVYTSCKTGQGISELRQIIRQIVAALPHVNDWLPIPWFKVKERLQQMKKDVISYDRYEELCQEEGIQKPTEQRMLIRLLHDLGTVLNFHDDRRLEDTNVLNPNWVTRGIYQILDAPVVLARGGVLHANDLDHLLDAKTYPPTRHWILLLMMEKFELCFRFMDSTERYLIPGLLPSTEPDLGWLFDDSLAFQIHYTHLLPDSILNRLTVRKYRLIERQTYWKKGVVLIYEGARALVKADREDKKLFIWITGTPPMRRHLLTIIRAELADIHASFAAMPVQEMVPIPEYNGLMIPYDDLCAYEEYGELFPFYPPIRAKIDVRKLLNGIESPEARQLPWLQDMLSDRLNEEELRDLCWRLKVGYEDLGGIGKCGKTREMLLFLERHGRLNELFVYLRQHYPHVFY